VGGTENAVNGALIYNAVTRTMSEGTSNNRKRYDFSRIRLTSCRSAVPRPSLKYHRGFFPPGCPGRFNPGKMGFIDTGRLTDRFRFYDFQRRYFKPGVCCFSASSSLSPSPSVVSVNLLIRLTSSTSCAVCRYSRSMAS